MEAADRVDSTVGLQMAYLKQWASRSFNDLELRVPKLLPKSPHGSGTAFQGDAMETIQQIAADLVYVDPPYNQHSYLGNYHIWETLVRWDKPSHYGVACKREDVRSRKSSFNKKQTIAESFQKILVCADCRYVLVSFNDEGFLTREEISSLMLQNGKHLETFEYDYKRHVCSQIGIHNLKGEVVGEAGKKTEQRDSFSFGEVTLETIIQVLKDHYPQIEIEILTEYENTKIYLCKLDEGERQLIITQTENGYNFAAYKKDMSIYYCQDGESLTPEILTKINDYWFPETNAAFLFSYDKDHQVLYDWLTYHPDHMTTFLTNLANLQTLLNRKEIQKAQESKNLFMNLVRVYDQMVMQRYKEESNDTSSLVWVVLVFLFLLGVSVWGLING